MKESTELGQDKAKISRLVVEMHELIDKYYPGEGLSGLEAFEILDALALFTVYIVTLGPAKLIPTAKKYFSQRLVEFSLNAPREDENETSAGL